MSGVFAFTVEVWLHVLWRWRPWWGPTIMAILWRSLLDYLWSRIICQAARMVLLLALRANSLLVGCRPWPRSLNTLDAASRVYMGNQRRVYLRIAVGMVLHRNRRRVAHHFSHGRRVPRRSTPGHLIRANSLRIPTRAIDSLRSHCEVEIRKLRKHSGVVDREETDRCWAVGLARCLKGGYR